MIALLILLAQWPGIPDVPPSQYPPPVYQPYYQPPNPYLEWQQQRDWAEQQQFEQRLFQQRLLELEELKQ